MTRLYAFWLSVTDAVQWSQPVPDRQLVIKALNSNIEFCEARKRFDANGRPVRIATPQPAATATGSAGKVLTWEEWLDRHAPEHKRTA